MLVEHGFMESQCCSENMECILVKLTVKLFVSPCFFEYVNLCFLVNHQTVLKHLVSIRHYSSPSGKYIEIRYVKVCYFFQGAYTFMKVMSQTCGKDLSVL